MTLPILRTITLFQGATSQVELDLSDWDMSVGTCLFTAKHLVTGEIIKQVEFTEAGVHILEFKDDETVNLEVGTSYAYDIMLLIGEERYPQCAVSKIEVKKVVGAYAEN